ncbi:PREDICTED: putative uncharacterized protein DDB_G0282133 [Vollenhovia emeryi]|uniref:putative uncharacterized protein DDB_G0282133 n=1 Tax=Vollenhovia emeryi TaxID=411798 RepID=UPI0005F53DFD|nr:PREDICTED: putative uncharacterized protein DDB_G0282133 [Vollenhovia emeryi]
MFVLIYANGRYVIVQKIKNRRIIKNSRVIAVHKDRCVLQEIANNLKVETPTVQVLNLSKSDLSSSVTTNTTLNSSTSNLNASIEDNICTSSNTSSHNVEQCTICVKSNFNSIHCNNKNGNNEIRDVTNLNDTAVTEKNSDLLFYNNNLMNDMPLSITTNVALNTKNLSNTNTNIGSDTCISAKKSTCDVKQCTSCDKSDCNSTHNDNTNVNKDSRDCTNLHEDTSEKNSDLLFHKNKLTNDMPLSVTANAALNPNVSKINTDFENDACISVNKSFCDIEQPTSYDKSNSKSTHNDNTNDNNETRDCANLHEDTAVIKKNSDLSFHKSLVNGNSLIYTNAYTA